MTKQSDNIFSTPPAYEVMQKATNETDPSITLPNEIIQNLPFNFAVKAEKLQLQLQLDSAAAKETFEAIISAIEGRVSDFDRALNEKEGNDEEIIDEIVNIQKGVKDSALQVFANAAKEILKLLDADARTNGLAKLQEKFEFLGEGDKTRDLNQVQNLVLEAMYKVGKEVPGVVEAIQNGLKNSFDTKDVMGQEEFSKEERVKEWWQKEKLQLISARKVGTALVLAFFVPSPAGLMAAIGFLAATSSFDKGLDEKDSELLQYRNVWQEFMEESKRGLEAEQKKGYFQEVVNVTQNKNSLVVEVSENEEEGEKHDKITDEDRDKIKSSPTHLGMAVASIVNTEETNLRIDSKRLTTDQNSLRASTSGKLQ